MVKWTARENIPGDITFDSYFSSAANMNFIHKLGRTYVADLKFNRKVWFKGEELKASGVAARIPPDDRKQLSEEEGGQWYFTKTVRMEGADHPVRILILWDRKNGAEPKTILLTNKVQWEAHRITEVYRKRWTGTETFHRDGKQELGLGDCQLRSGEGQNRHLYLVMTAYSLLVAKLKQGGAREWGHQLIRTIGEACRGILKETLGKTIDWVIRMTRQETLSKDAILEKLALA
ncbi:MAG TPA: transposase [Fibrobacteria bacterium]|nr:transposase [Fibrobacteria bacterium]